MYQCGFRPRSDHVFPGSRGLGVIGRGFGPCFMCHACDAPGSADLTRCTRFIRFRTFDTCHGPPRRVSMPRSFGAAAIVRRLVAPPARMSATTSAKSAACSPALALTARMSSTAPFPASLRASAPSGCRASPRAPWKPPAPPLCAARWPCAPVDLCGPAESRRACKFLIGYFLLGAV